MRKLVVVVMFAMGCGTAIQVTRINPPPHAEGPRPPESVQVFTSGPPTDRHFVDVAYLEAQQQSELSSDNTPQFIGRLRETASRMGCDAIVIGAPTYETHSSVFDYRAPASSKGIVATCIMFTDDATAAVTPR